MCECFPQKEVDIVQAFTCTSVAEKHVNKIVLHISTVRCDVIVNWYSYLIVEVGIKQGEDAEQAEQEVFWQTQEKEKVSVCKNYTSACYNGIGNRLNHQHTSLTHIHSGLPWAYVTCLIMLVYWESMVGTIIANGVV